MTTPHCVQRGTFKDDAEPIGIDALISLDYMGSSEFEFGALPKSLKRICLELDGYVVCPTTIISAAGEELFVIYRRGGWYKTDADMLKVVQALATDSIRLKECSYLPRALVHTDTRRVPNFWWDIDNDFMLCLGKENSDKLMTAIKAVKERKRKEQCRGWY